MSAAPRDPVPPSRPLGRGRRAAAALLPSALVLAIAGVVLAVDLGLQWLITYATVQADFDSASDAALYGTGLSAGIGLVLLFAAALLTPLAWRHTADPRRLRALALLSVQVCALGLAALVPPAVNGAPLAVLASMIGTILWWRWQERWRGTGAAPSALSGVLRPAIRAGQVWFAYVPGEKESKTRPVIVLKQGSGGRWVVAYCTSKPPKPHLADRYVPVPSGMLRGLRAENWVHIHDVRALGRGSFRTYIGLTPQALYDRVCDGSRVQPDTSARTLEETQAGGAAGPLERAIRQSLGVYRHGEPHKSVQDDEEVIRSARGLLGTIVPRKGRHSGAGSPGERRT